MTCEQVNDELSAYLDGELPADARAAVESHLAGCVECKQAAEELKSIAAAIHDLPRLKAPVSLVATVHDRVQKSPAPLLLIDGAPPMNASDEVLKPRSMWGPVAFGIAAVLMLFALAFAVMPAISNNGDSTAMRGEKRRKTYESDRSERVVPSAPAEDREVASVQAPAPKSAAPLAENAKTAAPAEAEKLEAKADSAATFGAAPKPSKPGTFNEGLAADGKPENLNKASETRSARKAPLDAELRKREETLAAVTPVPATTPAPVTNANGISAERRALQMEKQAEANVKAPADAVPMEEAVGKKQAERSGGARRSATSGSPAPGALPQAPGNAAPAVVAPSAPPAPAPKPIAPATPAPFAAAPKVEKADALAKAAPQEQAAGQDKATTGEAKKKDADILGGKELAAKEAGELRLDEGGVRQEQIQGGKGAARGAAPADNALAGKPSATVAPPQAKRARPGEVGLDEDDNLLKAKDGGNVERLKALKDEADRRIGGIGGEGGAGAGAAQNGNKPAMAFRTRDPQTLRAQMAELAVQHGGTLVSKSAGSLDLVAHIPPAKRNEFMYKLSQLQAKAMDEAAKASTASKAAAASDFKHESQPTAAAPDPLAKEKSQGKLAPGEVIFSVVIETIAPVAAPAEAAQEPKE